MQDDLRKPFYYHLRKNKRGQDDGLNAVVGKEQLTFDGALMQARFCVEDGYVTTIHRYDVDDHDGSTMKIVAIFDRQEGVA